MTAWQFNTSPEVARLFRMRLVVAHVLPMWGWDTYQTGRGRMLGKALGLLTVADGSGPQFDTSELVTWLNDAVLLAPGMLLDERTSWQALSDDSFQVTMTDAGLTVSAEVFLDSEDRPRDFRTQDRCADLPEGLVQAPWSTPVGGWTVVAGRPRLTRATAVWHLPQGEYCYAEMTLLGLELDAPASG